MKSATRETGTETSCLIEPPSRPLDLGQHLAQLPQRGVLRLARADRRVLDEPVLDGAAEHRLDHAREVGVGAGRGQLDEGVGGMVAGKRLRHAVGVLEDQLQPEARDVLEGGELVARLRAKALEHLERRLRPLAAEEGGDGRFRLGVELEHRGRDHAERALRADEEVL